MKWHIAWSTCWNIINSLCNNPILMLFWVNSTKINNLDFNPEMIEKQIPLPFHSPMKWQQTSTDWSLHRRKGHWWLLTTLTVGILGRNQATKIDGLMANQPTPPSFRPYLRGTLGEGRLTSHERLNRSCFIRICWIVGADDFEITWIFPWISIGWIYHWCCQHFKHEVSDAPWQSAPLGKPAGHKFCT